MLLSSRPVRGVWVETRLSELLGYGRRHAPHGACGLKQATGCGKSLDKLCHAPHGACGLKRHYMIYNIYFDRSRPARGVWVETAIHHTEMQLLLVTPRTGRVG